MPSLGNYDRLAEISASKDQINQARTLAESVLRVNGYEIQFDLPSRERMSLVIGSITDDEVIEWKMLDNQVVSLTGKELRALYDQANLAAGARILKVHKRAQQLKDKLSRGEKVSLREIQLENW